MQEECEVKLKDILALHTCFKWAPINSVRIGSMLDGPDSYAGLEIYAGMNMLILFYMVGIYT
jgi:hypothetical protein